jgi:hypothetical protein
VLYDSQVMRRLADIDLGVSGLLMRRRCSSPASFGCGTNSTVKPRPMRMSFIAMMPNSVAAVQHTEHCIHPSDGMQGLIAVGQPD